ncbi:hypothetical protein OAN96_01115 [Candidatus Gracilibacteria bacterium]|nr:hypothetical protein [Candidatus Gracilibacteria bacterium]
MVTPQEIIMAMTTANWVTLLLAIIAIVITCICCFKNSRKHKNVMNIIDDQPTNDPRIESRLGLIEADLGDLKGSSSTGPDFFEAAELTLSRQQKYIDETTDNLKHAIGVTNDKKSDQKSRLRNMRDEHEDESNLINDQITQLQEQLADAQEKYDADVVDFTQQSDADIADAEKSEEAYVKSVECANKKHAKFKKDAKNFLNQGNCCSDPE